MKRIEDVLVAMDSGLSGACSRIILGLCIPPLFRVLSGGRDRFWVYLVLFLALLIALRVGPAVLRKALPFSVEAQKIWSERRQLAKRYDSYQWRKLFWIGLGLLAYGFIGGGLKSSELALMIICLASGAAGLLVWRKIYTQLPHSRTEAPSL